MSDITHMWEFIFGTLCGACAVIWVAMRPVKQDMTAITDSYLQFRQGNVGRVVILNNKHRKKYIELMANHYAETIETEFGIDANLL